MKLSVVSFEKGRMGGGRITLALQERESILFHLIITGTIMLFFSRYVIP